MASGNSSKTSPASLPHFSKPLTNGFHAETPSANGTASDSHDIIPAWVNPDLDRLVQLHRQPGDFASYATSRVERPAGAIFARITTATPAAKAYSTVQVAADRHVELNSDLLYINHSCQPSLEFDMERWEVRVARNRDLHVGDLLSFFYPSTEWEMDQAFECHCREQSCLGHIAGASRLDQASLQGRWLNRHIEELKQQRQDQRAEQ